MEFLANLCQHNKEFLILHDRFCFLLWPFQRRVTKTDNDLERFKLLWALASPYPLLLYSQRASKSLRCDKIMSKTPPWICLLFLILYLPRTCVCPFHPVQWVKEKRCACHYPFNLLFCCCSSAHASPSSPSVNLWLLFYPAPLCLFELSCGVDKNSCLLFSVFKRMWKIISKTTTFGHLRFTCSQSALVNGRHSAYIHLVCLQPPSTGHSSFNWIIISSYIFPINHRVVPMKTQRRDDN